MSTESETPRNIATPLNPQGSVASDIKARLPEISDYKSHDFDTGVFHYEMLKLAIVPDAPPAYAEVVKKGVDPREQGVLEGTFEGTQRALTEAFNMAEKQFSILYNVALVDTIFPRADDLQTKRVLYNWSTADDQVERNRRASKLKQEGPRKWIYPPHCAPVPPTDLKKLQEAQAWREEIAKKEKEQDPHYDDPLGHAEVEIIDPVKGVPIDKVFDLLALKNVQLIIPKVVPIKIKDFDIGGHLPNPIKKGIDYLRYNAVLPNIFGIDDKFGGKGVPTEATTIEDIREFCQNQRNSNKEDRRAAYLDPNICDREDWFSDAVFGQQQFTGVNPTTIEIVSEKFFKEFIETAKAQGRNDVAELLTSKGREAFYMQDCSYFRKAVGISNPKADIVFEDELNGDKFKRWNAASVTLFHLPDDGRLHPISIVLDYKGTMKDSVTAFNKRIKAHHVLNEPAPGEKEDWAWRYAKTVSQSADWLRHEIGVHLVNTHLVEEAVIVATQRSFEWNHIILRLLYPHWYKTLPLNEGARTVLVPMIIADLVGLSAEQLENLVAYHYRTYDFQKTYVPHDLERRGFPVSPLRDNTSKNRFTNYGYAKNILPFWEIIRNFVSTMLRLFYLSDSQVADDADIKRWIRELRGEAGGQLTSFPSEIKTVDQLVDVVTNCIHIASPLHTAINYLQQYHMSWILNKPPCLCAPLPQSLKEFKSITEFHIVQTLPTFRPRDWLLASHIPYLLSIRTDARTNSIAKYAWSLYRIYEKKKTVEDETKDYRGDENASKIRNAAKKFWDDLREFDFLWPEISNSMWDPSVSYNVLDPDDTAVSILL